MIDNHHPSLEQHGGTSAEAVTLVLESVRRGDGGASKDLLPVVYEELRRLAISRMAHELAGQTLQATALVHEAWLRLVNNGDRTWQNRAHFFGAAAEAMRRILIENARRKSRLKRGGHCTRVDLVDVELADTTSDQKILLIDEALEELEASDPDKARVVVLKFFGGMTNQEVAENLAVNERTVERHWAFAKAWLFQSIRGRTRCE
ncbi:sigma-70 family RNA polymerase sigma factor [Luteolibacter marinus]|uniref:sigma-70 family RNA polymerase sigma factor n=1 Tax=Luteolibacter marinus TaxID=2776705 RepID=UPI001868E885|nr:sigma-70 family RNA polymerase sigma factor [Luteolibacter marinus]